MNNEKRLFLFLALSLLILLFFSRFYSQQAPAPSPKESRDISQDSRFPAVGQKAVDDKLAGSLVLPEDRNTVDFETEEYIVTICLTGGYIKQVLIKEYEEILLYQDFLVVGDYIEKEFQLERIPEGFRLVCGPQDSQIIKEVRFVKPYAWRVVIKSPTPFNQVGLLSQKQEKDRFFGRYQEFFYRKDLMTRLGWGKLKNPIVLSDISVLGARDRYYAATLFDFSGGSYILSAANSKASIVWRPESASYFEASLFLGPQKKEYMQHYDIQDVINFGFFHSIAMVILNILHFFFSIFKNWGLSIIIFSILIYVVFFPLTFRSSKSMKEMREFQSDHKAEVEKLREKYKDQPQKLHQATLELYKKYGFNPLKGCSSGCLPLFFQIPVIWALWGVIPRALEFKGANFLWIKDLSLPDKAFCLSFDLPFLGNCINILPLLTAVIMYVQMKFTSPEVDPTQAQQQKIMSLIFPVMMGFIFYQLPSALLLYWFTNSVLTFLSQWHIMKAKAS
ncbi:MAG: membrane protein insertase YidC [Candidatus Omnitrophica bacterium]|nr:membrane protein insertase YidC [Candidatus Omnitrophota bacterium]